MSKRMTESQIVSILKEADLGVPVKELCRQHGIASSTFYKWKAKYGGMEAGVCQHSCHPYLNQATETSLALTRLDRRTGLRAVGSTGEQFLTALPFQRAGFTCFAITSTDSRLARISPSLSV